MTIRPAKKSAKETAKGNLSRRRFPLESFPIGQGAAAPLRSPGVYGGRGTRDGVWTGKTDCHSRCAHRLRNDGDGGFARCGGTRVWTGPFPLGRVCVLSRGTGDPRAKSAAAINDPDSLFRARATCVLQSVSGCRRCHPLKGRLFSFFHPTSAVTSPTLRSWRARSMP